MRLRVIESHDSMAFLVPSTGDKTGRTAIHAAATHAAGHTLVQHFLSNGSQLQALQVADQHGLYPFHIAAAHGHLQNVIALLPAPKRSTPPPLLVSSVPSSPSLPLPSLPSAALDLLPMSIATTAASADMMHSPILASRGASPKPSGLDHTVGLTSGPAPAMGAAGFSLPTAAPPHALVAPQHHGDLRLVRDKHNRSFLDIACRHNHTHIVKHFLTPSQLGVLADLVPALVETAASHKGVDVLEHVYNLGVLL